MGKKKWKAKNPEEWKKNISNSLKGKGLGNQHAKGHVSWNKGTKGVVKKNKTSFEKGQTPWNKGLKKECDKRLDYERPTIFKQGNVPYFKFHKVSNDSKNKMRLGKLGKRGEQTNNWQGGLSFETYPEEFDNKIKIKIRERDGYICQICEKYGNCVHHIDYNKQNCDEENLITLCPRCHFVTNGKRDYWKMKLQIFMKSEMKGVII